MNNKKIYGVEIWEIKEYSPDFERDSHFYERKIGYRKTVAVSEKQAINNVRHNFSGEKYVNGFGVDHYRNHYTIKREYRIKWSVDYTKENIEKYLKKGTKQ